jgi:N-acetylglutamate synthase-like GNAT family acetyltransferase
MTAAIGPTPEIRRCDEGERPGVLALLEQNALPTSGLSDHWDRTWVAVDRSGPDGQVVGSVALEIHGTTALLRSFATRADHRGQGLGHALFEYAVARAEELKLENLALLTTTAESFFARRGFAPVSREELPRSLDASAELKGACPATARAMIRRLR